MSDTTPSPRDVRIAARLKSRYAAERRFKALGFAAVLFSALVLAFLLFTMTSNALGGFKRTELRFPIDFSAGLLNVDPSQLQSPTAMQALEGAGLKDVVAFAAAKELGDTGAAQVQDGAWREVGKALIADPTRLSGKLNVSLPASDDLAAAARGDGQELAARPGHWPQEGRQAGRRLRLGLPLARRCHRPAGSRDLGGAQGLDADHAGDLAAGLSGRGAGGGLP